MKKTKNNNFFKIIFIFFTKKIPLQAFQITSNPAHNEILCKHTVIGEVLEKLKAIAFQYVALLSVHRGTLWNQKKSKNSQNIFVFCFVASLQKFLNTRSRRKVEQFSSALLVEASVLAELSDDLLSQSDANYQSQGGEDEASLFSYCLFSCLYVCM